MTPDDARHGTYAGSQAHRRQGVPICEPCRNARNEYMAGVRKQPTSRHRSYNNARTRAIWQLVARHREEFDELYVIELFKLRKADAS